VGEHDALRPPRRARGGHDKRVAVVDRYAVGKCVLFAVGTHDASGTQRVEHRPSRFGRQPWVEWRGRVSCVPDGAEGIDKPHATREVECDELRHRPVA